MPYVQEFPAKQIYNSMWILWNYVQIILCLHYYSVTNSVALKRKIISMQSFDQLSRVNTTQPVKAAAAAELSL